MMAQFWTLPNAQWFAHDGKTFLKLHGGPDSAVFCLETKKITFFYPLNTNVTILK